MRVILLPCLYACSFTSYIRKHVPPPRVVLIACFFTAQSPGACASCRSPVVCHLLPDACVYGMVRVCMRMRERWPLGLANECRCSELGTGLFHSGTQQQAQMFFPKTKTLLTSRTIRQNLRAMQSQTLTLLHPAVQQGKRTLPQSELGTPGSEPSMLAICR